MDNYGRELAVVVGLIQDEAASTSVRGTGAARFIFVERSLRAVEISKNNEGWWTEFWDHDAVVMDQFFSSAPEAVQAARAWLAGNRA